jgi:hypothetical protein
LNRLETVSRLQDHAVDTSLPPEVREDCKQAAAHLQRAEGWFRPGLVSGGVYWPTPGLNLVPPGKFDNAEPASAEDATFARALACLVMR